MNREKVIAAVRDHLATVHHHGLQLEVAEAGVRKDGAWWYVPVLARGESKPPPDFLYSTYASIESDIAEELRINVLLVPTAEEISA